MARRFAGCLVLAVLAVGISAAQESSKKTDDAKKVASKKESSDTDASSGQVWMSIERYKELQDRYQKLREQIESLERQLKVERNLPSSVKLTGRLEGDLVALRAEFQFVTSLPGSTVFLGLKNGFLMDEGQSDDGAPQLEATEEGFYVRLRKEGPHRLTLNLRTPVGVKKGASTTERGFELSLPSAAATTVNLELGRLVKDPRCVEGPLTARRPGVWDATLGAAKSLTIAWKESAPAAGVSLGPSAKVNLKAKILEGRVEIAGELTLEDAKNPTRDWHVLLPPQAKVSAAPGSAAFTWLPPEGKATTHLIRVTEPAERVILLLQSQVVRGQASVKVPIGPVLVQETPTQGTILIQAIPGILRGQRLVYHSFGEIFQRDPPKGSLGLDSLALFQFWNTSFSGKGLSPAKAPLELEWKTEKGQLEAAAEHDVKIRDDRGQWLFEVDSKFAIQSVNSRLDTLEIQMPPASLPDLLWLGAAPMARFPAALTWPVGLAPRPTYPLSVTAVDDSGPLDVSPADGQQRIRLKLGRPIGNEIIVRLQTRSTGPGDVLSYRIGVPRVLGAVDRGAMATMWTPAGHEFLVGSPESPEPVQEKVRQTLEQMPSTFEMAWRPTRRHRPARTIADVVVREQGVQVKQTLSLPVGAWTGGATMTGQIALRLPSPGFAFNAVNTTRLSQDKSLAWVKLPAAADDVFEIELAYDVARSAKDDTIATPIPLLWPDGATSRDAKVRIWSDPGVAPMVQGMGEIWKERPLEEGSVAGIWPAVVVAGMGEQLPLAVRLEQSGQRRLPVLVADRSLVQVRVDEDGSQFYRCRYLVRKFTASTLEIELPVAWDHAQPHFRFGGREISGLAVVDRARNRVGLPLPPSARQSGILEITYQAPATQVNGRSAWQAPLMPPRFVGDVSLGAIRWQLTLPDQQVPILLGSQAVDVDWRLRNWLLTPGPAATSADLDVWIGGDPGDGEPVSLAWWRATMEPQRVYFFPRQMWLLLTSGIVLVLGLIVLSPAPRIWIVAIVAGAALLTIGLALFHDHVLSAVFFGAQPALVVLALLMAGRFVVGEVWRRRESDMSTFSRVPPGSTIVRAPIIKPQSTIDAPAANTGSVKNAN